MDLESKTSKRVIPFSPPDISELEISEVAEALRSGWITTGPRTKQFEREIADYCNTEKAVCLNSATAALELVLRLLGIGAGDEVITCAYTYTASASVVCHVGAKLVLVDTAPDSLEMDYDKLAQAVNENTKAIIPVDVAGIICDYDRIFKIVESKKNIFAPNSKMQAAIGQIAVIADCAHSFGSVKNGRMAGEIADFSAFSFHAVKNLTTAEGGAVTWRKIKGIDSEEIYKEFQLLSLHGQSKDALAKTKLGAWEYDIIYPAYKCNMSDISAAIGLKQLERFSGLLDRRRQIIRRYDEALKPLGVITLEHFGKEHASNGHLYITRIPGIDESRRGELISQMAENGVACNVHYKPLPLLTAYKNLDFDIKDFPNAYRNYANEITLPLHTKLSDEDVEYVIDTYSKLLKG